MRRGALVERLRAIWQEGGHDPADWEMPDEWIDGRTELPLGGRELLAVPTPGHTRGHLVYADLAGGLLFAGDHVLPHITPSIGFESAPESSPLDSYLSSLRLMRELPDLRLLPAHGPVTDSVHARVDALLDHHADRLDACAAAVTAGSGTAYETARALTWTRRERHFDDLDLFNQMLATTETRAHLEVLVAQSRLGRHLRTVWSSTPRDPPRHADVGCPTWTRRRPCRAGHARPRPGHRRSRPPSQRRTRPRPPRRSVRWSRR